MKPIWKASSGGPTAGIALILVLVVIFMLSILAGGFAYSMKVEMRLAKNHSSEAELEWIGRSGVELARYVLAQQMLIPGENSFDSLNQKWAGGVGVTNEILAPINLDNYPLGSGSFSVKITDLERKFNINVADRVILQQAMNLVGLDAVEASTVMDSIIDWRDPDENPGLNGAESDYYLGLKPPYYSKNGPIDDLTELLMVKGIRDNPQIYWGPAGPNHGNKLALAPTDFRSRIRSRSGGAPGTVQYQAGLVDLFTPLAAGMVNVNTASPVVLQLFPGITPNAAQAIVQMRAGPDGVEGDQDDMPFRNPGELVNVPGIDRGLVPTLMRYLGTRSYTFEVEVTARIGNYQRHYIAVLHRNNPRDIQTLYLYWR